MDAIEAELFRNALAGIGDEMVLTIYRTAYSGVLKNIMDYSAAICDARGRLVAQGLSLPGHLCSIPVALKAALARFGNDIAEGDVLVLNDPYEGGMHLPDIFLFKPIFADGVVLAYGATICHHTDVGGRVPGSNASDSTEIFAEGLRIPPLKLYERGRPNQTLFRVIERNVRLPGRVFGDLRSQLAACEIAARGIADLVARHGARGTRRLMEDALDYSERLTRRCLAELADGEACFTDWIDDDQIDVGTPIKLACTVRKRGERMEFDWTGSAAQVRGAINNTWSYTAAASYTAAKSILSANMPNNDGVFRAISVTAPAGTITNALPPAACAARGLTGFRCADAAFGALALLYPDRVFAASDGGNTGITVAGYDTARRPFIYVDFLSAAWGARPWADGLEGNTTMFANMASFSVEVIEAENPLEILDNEFVPDTGGAGRFRGGAALRRTWRMLAEEGILQVRADRQTHRPYGLHGGGPGEAGRSVLDPGEATEQVLHAKITRPFRRDEVFRHDLPGGGGWGDALTRDLAAVAKDLRDGLVTIAGAARDYGVVARGDPPEIDREATEGLRAWLRARRGTLPMVAWESLTPPPGPLPQREGEKNESPLPLREGVGGGVRRT
ncbi:MAG TPA: hydantoinase B/oxoprolinase family protein [Acetobacteraceae bacterium]|nr:hydantoinase B/oxoprolinase family protein [Acetobacteraceae bacterium]